MSKLLHVNAQLRRLSSESNSYDILMCYSFDSTQSKPFQDVADTADNELLSRASEFTDCLSFTYIFETKAAKYYDYKKGLKSSSKHSMFSVFTCFHAVKESNLPSCFYTLFNAADSSDSKLHASGDIPKTLETTLKFLDI